MLLEVKDLTAGYGSMQVLEGIDLEVNDGEVVSIIGENGSGKSTTLKCIFGFLKPAEGRIYFGGRDITGIAPHSLVNSKGNHKRMAYVLQGRKLFYPMTVEENLQLGGYSIHDKKLYRERLQFVYNMFSILWEKKKDIAASLSGGELQMLAIAKGLMLKPDLLLLDEPSLGLAPQMVEEIFQEIEHINKQGIAVLLVEQNVIMALKVANRVYAYEIGEKPKEIAGEQLDAMRVDLTVSQELRKIYLDACDN